MRYCIRNHIVIKSENAAQSCSRPSKCMSAYISGLPMVERSFDYGCGKLRYAETILKTTDSLCVVDSEVQLSRVQKLGDETASIRNYTSKKNNMHSQSVRDFLNDPQKYDRGFCLNVLSTVPIISIRHHIVRSIYHKLKHGGSCLFVVQYRNSEFTRMANGENAVKWRDGFLIDSLRGYSFYALIRPEALTELVKGEGFKIEEVNLDEGRVYLLAYKN